MSDTLSHLRVVIMRMVGDFVVRFVIQPGELCNAFKSVYFDYHGSLHNAPYAKRAIFCSERQRFVVQLFRAYYHLLGIEAMHSECTLIGYVSQKPETGVTKTGYHSARSRVEVADMKSDGTPWRNWVPCIAFGVAADRLAEFDEGDLVVLKGRLTWQSDTSSLAVVAREVSKFTLVPYSQAAEAAIDA